MTQTSYQCKDNGQQCDNNDAGEVGEGENRQRVEGGGGGGVEDS